MQNLTEYKPAKVENDSSKELKFLGKILWLFVKSSFLSIPDFLFWLQSFIIKPKPKNISGQLAVVTGGSNGIGKAIAMRLAERGCNIAIANRNLAEGQKTAKEIEEKFNVKVKAFKVDVSKQSEVAKLKVDVESSLGTVDILVNNAGLLSLKTSLLEGTPEEIQQVIDVNLTSYFWTAREFLPGMIERKRGHILAVSSLSAKVSSYDIVAYTTTKSGNAGFMQSLHEDLCLKNQDEFIKLTTVYPAYVSTQKDLQDLIRTACDIPFYDPDYIAKLIVNGMLINRREFIVPPIAGIFQFFNFLPDKIMKASKLSLLDSSKVENFKEKRKSL